MAAPRKILVCEDEDAIREFEVINLQRSGYEVVDVSCGEDAIRVFDEEGDSFSVAILDIMMPGIDGFAVCKHIREKNNTLGIIMLSAKSQEMDKVNGLMLGADDYITKPFNPVTLGAKVKALIRRSRNQLSSADNVLTAGPFQFHMTTMRLHKNGQEIVLSPKESAIMRLFLDNVNRIFSKDMLYELVWGNAIVDDNTIMVYINRLRQKIEDDPADPHYIQTVRGLGYRFVV